MPKILMVLTSHDQLGNTGAKTGFWLEEFAAPYYVFKDAGADVTLASPQGGQPPLDPKSDDAGAQTDATRRFKADAAAQKQLASTQRLADVQAADYDAVFYPGGHGPLWDLAEDAHSIALIEATLNAGKPVAAVCHGLAGVQRGLDQRDGVRVFGQVPQRAMAARVEHRVIVRCLHVGPALGPCQLLLCGSLGL